MRRAFAFDASACTGCKACQMACKDKHALPAGVLWRRVYEVTGGEWERRGAAWTNTVFAYNVSVACNHCADPACAAACPTGACTVRDDGIVWIDAATCIGCEYCGWACPYGAPQYSYDLGRMTKCDFCRDLLDEHLSPACVAACPMRALDCMPVPDGAAVARPVFPLPNVSRTQPNLVVKPHPAMRNTLAKTVANREEVRPPVARRSRTLAGVNTGELPLVVFTLLAQGAAGAAVLSFVTGFPTPALLSTIGGLIAAGVLASLLHLGTVRQAWRAAGRPIVSPLSGEVVTLGAFTAAWLSTWFFPEVGKAALAACGIALIWAMGRVYVLEAVPGWNRWRTHAAFAGSSLLLGGMILLACSRILSSWLIAVLGVAMLAEQVWRRLRFYQAIRAKPM